MVGQPLQKMTDSDLRRKLEKAQREWARTGSMASLLTLQEFRTEAERRVTDLALQLRAERVA